VPRGTRPVHRRRTAIFLASAGLSLFALVAGCGASSPAANNAPQTGLPSALQNPAVDTGTPLGGTPAPDFTLTDQFGRSVRLSQFRGRSVLLAFVDSRCTTICPLSTISMVRALSLLGPAARRVQLLGIDANPQATSVADVRAYSQAHDITSDWHFLTAPLPRLKLVWKAYHVYVAAIHGAIDHQPAIYLIDPAGRERLVFLTQMSYASVDQQAQLLANAVARTLPGHPAVRQAVALRYRRGIGPASTVRLPVVAGAGAGGVAVLGKGRPHLVVFVASWLTETSDLAARLAALDRYQQAARRHGWPTLVVVDEAMTELNPVDLPGYLRRAGVRLTYPVAVDDTGRLADGYAVADEPWMDLVSASGRVLLRNDGWFAVPALERAVRRALARG
jgi:cytochrome oxidase Cu insertion factor (SCO1/SenC/PrrC family)